MPRIPLRSTSNPAHRPIDWTAISPLASVIIWSGNAIVTKLAAAMIEPASITFYRWLVAFALLLPLLGPGLWISRDVVVAHWQKLAVLGILGMGFYQGLAYEAARTTSAVNMGVILALMPLASSMTGSLFAGERITSRALIGIVVALAGVVVITTKGHPEAMINGIQRGDALMLIAILSNALYGALVRRWAIPLDNWRQLLAQIGFSLIFLFPVYLLFPITLPSKQNLPLIAYAGIPASILARFFWLVGTKRLGAGRVALFMNLLPILVAMEAWALLGEQLQTFHLWGGAIALAGVAIALYPLAKPSSDADPTRSDTR